MHLSESRLHKKIMAVFHKLQAAGIAVVTESLFGFTKLILHHPRAVTAASRASTIADLALGTTRQPEPYMIWSRYTHTLPYLTLISTVWALVCATAPPVRSPAKASAILNETVTAAPASRFPPWKWTCGLLERDVGCCTNRSWVLNRLLAQIPLWITNHVWWKMNIWQESYSSMKRYILIFLTINLATVDFSTIRHMEWRWPLAG